MEEIKRFLAVCTALTLLVHDIVQAIDNFNNVEIVLKNQTARKMVGYNGAKFPNVENLFGVKGNQVTTLRVVHTKINNINCTVMGGLTSLLLLEISSNPKLRYIPPKCFSKNPKLIEIKLDNNALESLSSTCLEGTFKKDHFDGKLYLQHNRLRKFPNFISPTKGLVTLNLDKNPIDRISQKDFKNLPKLAKLSMVGTSLTAIPENTFNKSKKLHEINLSHCRRLKHINNRAFVGAESLERLILDNTLVGDLPSKGLSNLKFLSLKGMKNLWEIKDDIASLPKLKTVNVPKTRRFLCCAFEYKRRDVLYHPTHQVTNVTRKCRATVSPAPTISVRTTRNPWGQRKATIRSIRSPWGQSKSTVSTTKSSWGSWGRRKRGLLWFGSDGDGFQPGNKTTQPTSKSAKTDDFGVGDWGVKKVSHPDASGIVVIYHCKKENITSSSVTSKLDPVQCSPEPDLLRPCDDIMGDIYLTVMSWFVSFVAILTNAAVFGIMVISRRSFSVSNFLITNLSFSDLCLGLYLFILVCASTDTSGNYYNYVESWQFNGGCHVTGFLAIFSSQLSMLTLTIITVERYLAIVYAMYLQKRLEMPIARLLVIGSWLLAITLAILPLFGFNSYEEVAICLPFRTDNTKDFIYLGTLLALDTVLFFIILICYGKMYWVVHSPHSSGGGPTNDSSVARRMALLIFTDFACWMPIAVLGVISASGYSEAVGMTVRKAKYLLVIFFPINSICNPFLYALSTKYFRREFYMVLSQCGLCEKRVSDFNSSYSRSKGSRRKSRGMSETLTSEVNSPSLLVRAFISLTNRRPSSLKNDNVNGGKMSITSNGKISVTSASKMSETTSPDVSPSLRKVYRDVSPSEDCKDRGGVSSVRFSDEEQSPAHQKLRLDIVNHNQNYEQDKDNLTCETILTPDEVFNKIAIAFASNMENDRYTSPSILLRPLSNNSTMSSTSASVSDDIANFISGSYGEKGQIRRELSIPNLEHISKDTLAKSKESKC